MRYTVEDLWALSSRPAYEGKFLELIDGEIVRLKPAYAKASVISARIGVHLLLYAENVNPGYSGAAHSGYQLSEYDVLGPDAAYISKTRQPELPERYFTAAPELAVEVVSPTDSIKKVQRKARRYLEHGTLLVWIVYSDDETVDVCRLAEGGGMIIDEVGKDGVLEGGAALPGFALALSDLFRD